ncbi:hypothetical protein TNCV_2501531 [Trichonephila clavipes]|nr:hypothetical protein TNCV_2501531 [Trichonephila clavipes]
MWTRNYDALGQTTRVCFDGLCANKKKEEVKRDFGDLRIRRRDERRPEKEKKERGDPKGEVEGKGTRESGRENGRKEEKRARKREGLSAREVPAFRFSRRRMRKMFPESPPAMLRLRKGDLLEVARELGVEVNGDQTRVETKDMILQSDKNDMETIKAVMEGILEEKRKGS